MTKRYNVFAAAAKLNVSAEMIRKWCIEFERHLSPTANPGTNRTRVLTPDDLRILSLVAERRNEGLAYEGIHSELQNRGTELLAASYNDAEDSDLMEGEVGLILTRYETMQAELQTLRTRVEELQTYREENIRLEAQLEMERQRAQKSDENIQTLLNERRELDREIARLKILLEQASSEETE
jgi:DNA-binding transcriptional MerR regulator